MNVMPILSGTKNLNATNFQNSNTEKFSSQSLISQNIGNDTFDKNISFGIKFPRGYFNFKNENCKKFKTGRYDIDLVSYAIRYSGTKNWEKDVEKWCMKEHLDGYSEYDLGWDILTCGLNIIKRRNFARELAKGNVESIKKFIKQELNDEIVHDKVKITGWPKYEG